MQTQAECFRLRQVYGSFRPGYVEIECERWGISHRYAQATITIAAFSR